jgi:glycosyltransferase involved in cell wall biosynthesis
MRIELPLVSVIVAMRNVESHIGDCLASILSTTDVSLEVLIVDDQSTDRSLERAQSVRDDRVQVLQGESRGISASLNLGLKTARGSIIMRCDADDIYPAGRIREQALWLQSNQEFESVCGAFSTIDATGRHISLMPCGTHPCEITDELKGGRTRTHLCTFAIKSTAIQKLDGFRSFFETAEDIDFQLRLGEVCRVMYVPNDWYSYRLHAASITHRQGISRRAFYEEMAKEFQYQRKLTGLDALQQGCEPQVPMAENDASFTAEEHIRQLLLGRAWNEHRRGKKLKAFRSALRALRIRPNSLATWRNLIALGLKPARIPEE